MSTDPKRVFPDRLRHAREVRGLTQADLAERSGLQASAVSHFESGRRAPSFDNLRRLADALAVTTDYLLGRADAFTAHHADAAALFRDLGAMTSEDQAFLKQMMDLMAKRNQAKHDR